jgi:rod shape determining protein RodA
VGKYPEKHLWFAGAGVVVMFVTAFFHPWLFRRWSYAAYAGVLLLLVLLLGVATPVKGARGWFSIGALRVQPAEFMKLALVGVLARCLAAESAVASPLRFVAACLWVAVPAGLVFAQPDLGTALVYGPIFMGIALVAGVRRSWLLWVGGVLVVAAPLVYHFGLGEYQKNRLLAFALPERAPERVRYQQDHALRATASGGWAGVGSLEREAYPFVVPERHADFIFSVVGERYGFLGSSLILLLYAWLLYEAFLIARGTRDPFGRHLCVGVASFIGFQVLLNVAITLRLAPVTGLTLPLLSYGGSSMMTCCVGLGMVVAVSRRRVPSFRSGRVTAREPEFSLSSTF